MWPEDFAVQMSPGTATRRRPAQWSVHAQWQQNTRSCQAMLSCQRLEVAYNCVLSPVSQDLLDIALAVYASDRICPRRPAGTRDDYGMRWGRRIAVSLPLRDPAHWHSGNRMASLCSLLRHITGDRWCFNLIPGESGMRSQPQQQSLFRWPPPGQVDVAPFSGGLDSLAGAYNYLEPTPERVLSVIVGGSGTQVRGRQSELLRALIEHFPNRLIPIRILYRLWDRDYSTDDDESSQRSRGFMHLVLTAVAALMNDLHSAMVFENGIGALGLPYTYGQLGTHISRAVQPQTLALTSAFIKNIFGHSLRFYNPFILDTKSSVCALLAADWLQPLIARSVSCDRFPQRVYGHAQCGVCPSCLLRRVSLGNAGLAEADGRTDYRFDVTDPTCAIDEGHLSVLRTMLDQVGTFRACLADSGWEALSVRFPDILMAADALVQDGELSQSQVATAFEALVRAYVREWDSFPFHLPPRNLKLCS
jgi:hypothetical protein